MLPRSSLSGFKNVDSVRILCPVLLQITCYPSSRWKVLPGAELGLGLGEPKPIKESCEVGTLASKMKLPP